MSNPRRITRRFAVSALAVLASCAGASNAVRAPEVAPTERLLSQPLPDGVAETALAQGSAGVSATGAAPSRLLWIVATGTREYVYDVAGCTALSISEEAGDAVTAARCDGQRFEVVRDGERIELRREGTMVASLSIPRSWRLRLRSQ